jgi:hypothetical protein
MGRRPLDRTPRPCGYDGCTATVENRTGFCVAHYFIAYPCSFDESCKHRCAAHSRSRLCQEHVWYAEKLRRNTLADRLAAEGKE